jgi:PEP-CTERM putative exosortase interaction domain
MRIRSVVAAIALSTLALAGMSAQVRAATIVQAINFGPLGANASTPLSFLTFNSALGTLNSVTITLDTTLSARVLVNNLTAGSLTWTSATGSINTTATGPAGTSTATALAIVDNTGGTLGPGGSYTGGFIEDTDDDTANVAPADFAAYIGDGFTSYDITVASGPFGVTGNGDDGLLYGGNANVTGTVTVTYDYTAAAVPEPGTLALLAPALLMGGVVVARRRRSA